MNQTMTAFSLNTLKQLQLADCKMLEMTLRLEGNPGDRAALQQYNETAEKRRAAKESMDSDSRPYRLYGSTSSSTQWEWNRSSWQI